MKSNFAHLLKVRVFLSLLLASASNAFAIPEIAFHEIPLRGGYAGSRYRPVTFLREQEQQHFAQRSGQAIPQHQTSRNPPSVSEGTHQRYYHRRRSFAFIRHSEAPNPGPTE